MPLTRRELLESFGAGLLAIWAGVWARRARAEPSWVLFRRWVDRDELEEWQSVSLADEEVTDSWDRVILEACDRMSHTATIVPLHASDARLAEVANVIRQEYVRVW